MIASSGSVVVTNAKGEGLKLWDLQSIPLHGAVELDALSECVAVAVEERDLQETQCLCVHDDGNGVVLGLALENAVKILRLPMPDGGGVVEEIGDPLQLSESAQGMQFSANGRALLVFTRAEVLLCRVPHRSSEGNPIRFKLDNPVGITCACFLHHGAENAAPQICVADTDGVLRIWDVHGGEIANELVLDLSRCLGAHEQLSRVCQHPINPSKLVVASSHGQVWVCGYRGDLISVIASTSLDHEAAEQTINKQHSAAGLPRAPLGISWLLNDNREDVGTSAGNILLLTPSKAIELHPTQLTVSRTTAHPDRAPAMYGEILTTMDGTDVAVITYHPSGTRGRLIVRHVSNNELPSIEQKAGPSAASHHSAAPTAVASLFLRPDHEVLNRSVMATVMQHQRRKAPTAEQKQQSRQLSWDTFDRKQVAQSKKPQAKPVDMPITFHNRIKSSGYGQAKAPAKSRAPTSKTSSNAKKMRAMCTSTYPIGALLNTHQQANDLREPAPLRLMKFNADASLFALGYAGGEHSIRLVKHPVSRYAGDGFSLVGHQARVNCIDFSHDKTMLLSVSDDKSARLWKLNKGGELYTVVRHQKRSPRLEAADAIAAGASSSNDSVNPTFNAELLSGKFYGMDQLLCCTSGATAFLYAYEASAAAHEDISKHRNRFQVNYKLVHTWVADGQQLTSLACWNNTYSPYLIAGSTNRSVQIFDSAAMRTIHVFEDCHSKAISYVALPTPSQAAHVSQDKYTFFATCAADSAVKLWDVRTAGPTATLAEHTNNREAISCDISPCLTYVAIGSEDGRCYIYDIRTMRSACVLPGHRDVVSCCTFNPVHPQLATISYDNCVRFYTSNGRVSAETKL